jgi:pimeloyl-ACP methyl ester carboxylesterase
LSRYRVLQVKDGSSVVIADSGPAQDDFVVVAIPGWKGSDLGLWDVLRPTLLDGSRVIVINLPGAGISPTGPHSSASVDDLSALVEQVLQLVGATRTVLLGHSFGATLAASVASRRNAALAGLLLVSPEALPRIDHQSRLEVVAFKFLQLLPRTIQEGLITSRQVGNITNAMLSRRGWSGRRRIYTKSKQEGGLAADPRAMVNQLAVARSHGCFEFCRDVDADTAIIAGSRDQLSAVDDLQRLACAFRNAELELIVGAGHLAHHEDTEATGVLVAERVRRWTGQSGAGK